VREFTFDLVCALCMNQVEPFISLHIYYLIYLSLYLILLFLDLIPNICLFMFFVCDPTYLFMVLHHLNKEINIVLSLTLA
jgi:hypothetical protein